MNKFDLSTYEVEEMKQEEMDRIDGGLIPLAVFAGICAIEIACCAIALGMREAMKEHQ